MASVPAQQRMTGTVRMGFPCGSGSVRPFAFAASSFPPCNTAAAPHGAVDLARTLERHGST
jgi:hypothetical protein